MKPSEFLRLWFRVELGHFVYTVIGPRAGEFRTVHTGNAKQLEALDTLETKAETYFRVYGMAEPPPGKWTRGKAKKTSYVTGFGVDIDCGDKGNKKRYFPTREDAIAWVRANMQYTFLVSSGTGLHVYVHLDRPITITNDDEYAYAYAMSKAYSHWVSRACPYDVDPVFDLSRVLKLPGINGVEVLEHNKGRTIQRTAVERLLEETTIPLTPPSTVNSTGVEFTLDPNCEIPEMFVQAVIANTALAETWQGTRSPEDCSPSGLRFSMLSFCFNAGMTVQDAVDMTIRFLIDRRRVPLDKLKLDRPQLWKNEIDKAKYSTSSDESISAITSSGNFEEQLRAIAVLMTLPPDMLVDLHKAQVEDVDENGVAGLMYTMTFKIDEMRTVSVCTQNIVNRKAVSASIYSATGHLLQQATGKGATELNAKWNKALKLMWDVAVDDGRVINTTRDSFEIAIINHVNRGDLAASPEEAAETGHPYIDEDGGLVAIPAAEFQRNARIDYPDLRAPQALHTAVVGLEQRLKKKVRATSYRAVKLSWYLLPLSFVIKKRDESGSVV